MFLNLVEDKQECVSTLIQAPWFFLGLETFYFHTTEACFGSRDEDLHPQISNSKTAAQVNYSKRR